MEEKECPFCNILDKVDESRIMYQDSTWIAVLDGYPVSMGHTLLIPKRHCATYFNLNDAEMSTLNATIKKVKDILATRYEPQGFNIGVNCGKVAGQSVMHCHIHIIPRYEGDCENPRGGIRGCVPSRMNY